MSRRTRHLGVLIGIGAVALFLLAWLSLVSIAAEQPTKPTQFVLPEWGGAMVHSDPHLSDAIKLATPPSPVRVVWKADYYASERSQTVGNGVAGNRKIAACPFCSVRHNLIVYDYNGNRVWKSDYLLNADSGTNTPMVDKYNRIIACDNQRIMRIDPDINDDGEYVWRTDIPGIAAPLSPTITDNGVVVLPTLLGPMYAFDNVGGALLGSMSFSPYSLKNSVCVHGNRVYVLASRSAFDDSRLYAIDVNPLASPVFRVAWYYSFAGKSQASPTYISGTLYFDAYQGLNSNPKVYAVTDKGTYGSRKWSVAAPHTTLFSMSYDPRGVGIWYEDHTGAELLLYRLTDGVITQRISVNGLLYPETGFTPMSVMEVCGDAANPVMVVSANDGNPAPEKYYVLAIRLTDRSLQWKMEIPAPGYAGGQYTILTDSSGANPRIVFAAYYGKVYAIGQ